jgi:hypothetical protein
MMQLSGIIRASGVTIMTDDLEATNADAELIRLCASLPALADLSTAEADENGPHYQTLQKVFNTIIDIEPHTIMGVIAKARGMKAIGVEQGNAEVIFADLIRIGDAAA